MHWDVTKRRRMSVGVEARSCPWMKENEEEIWGRDYSRYFLWDDEFPNCFDGIGEDEVLFNYYD